MQDFLDSVGPRHVVMVAGSLLAAIQPSDLSLIQRALAFAAGMFAAYIGTSAALAFFQLDEPYVPLAAGGLALMGNGLVKTVLRISRDPIKFYNAWRSQQK